MTERANDLVDYVDLACIHCGYDLQGLDAAGKCPECGTPVVYSADSQRLAGANPIWLARIARGQSVLTIGLQVAVWAATAFIVSTFAMPALSGPQARVAATVFIIIAFGCMAVIFVGLVTATAGTFMITTLDPRETLGESRMSARLVARWGLLGVIVLLSGHFAASMVSSIPLQRLLQSVFILSLGAVVTIGVSATLTHLAKLARQIPHLTLLAQTRALIRQVRWVLPLPFLVAGLVLLYRAVSGGSLQTSGPPARYGVGCLTLVLVIVCLITAGQLGALASRYRRSFKACLVESIARVDAASRQVTSTAPSQQQQR